MPQTKTDTFLYIEDLRVGQKFSAGPAPVTEESIIAFAGQYDPQDLHTDPVKARDTVFGGLVASGWQTACLTMRMVVEASPKMKGGMVGRSIEKMDMPRPVRPGDQLSLEMEILDLRMSDSLPEYGIMRARNTTFNQKREVVLVMETVAFVPRKQKPET